MMIVSLAAKILSFSSQSSFCASTSFSIQCNVADISIWAPNWQKHGKQTHLLSEITMIPGWTNENVHFIDLFSWRRSGWVVWLAASHKKMNNNVCLKVYFQSCVNPAVLSTSYILLRSMVLLWRYNLGRTDTRVHYFREMNLAEETENQGFLVDLLKHITMTGVYKLAARIAGHQAGC
jgi:hypothetical protein